MQDRWDVAGLVGCMTGRMLDAGQEGYRTGGMQDMRD